MLGTLHLPAMILFYILNKASFDYDYGLGILCSILITVTGIIGINSSELSSSTCLQGCTMGFNITCFVVASFNIIVYLIVNRYQHFLTNIFHYFDKEYPQERPLN